MSDQRRETVEKIRRAKELDIDAFNDRVRNEGEVVKAELDAGTFDNDQNTIGLEYEFYAVDRNSAQLRRIPRNLLSSVGFEKELGLHNTELNSAVYPLNEQGVTALCQATGAKIAGFEQQAVADDIALVSDGMWTIGPEHSSAYEYLTETNERDGLLFAINVSNEGRYHSFANADWTKIGGTISLPGVRLTADTAGPVSLTTSIQPHHQLKRAAELPEYHAYALRIAGPLLALAANSPFLPPELYDDLSREVLLSESYAENRIPIYEDMMNPKNGAPKVKFPKDFATPAEAVDRIVADPVYVPADLDTSDAFDDQFAHFRYKHGSFWRWVRPVFEGKTPETANVRIEFRPLPAQPTVPDTVAFVVAVSGALTGLVETNHPVSELPWERAKANFYNAVRDGIDAEIAWVTADAEETASQKECFADLFSVTREGLRTHGFSESAIDRWLTPLETRAAEGITPAGWKRDQVAKRLDAGEAPTDAIYGMQREYIATQRETLFDSHFTDWL